jgi:hypothetical protein
VFRIIEIDNKKYKLVPIDKDIPKPKEEYEICPYCLGTGEYFGFECKLCIDGSGIRVFQPKEDPNAVETVFD